MAEVRRSTDIVEMIAERSVFLIGAGVVLLAVGGLFLKYKGTTGLFVPFGWVLFLIGALLLLAGAFGATRIRGVENFDVKCPYCEARNPLVEPPSEDFDCVKCHRMVPVRDGAVLPVMQVRCGFCRELNFYSEKTEVLICETCDREIPISQADGEAPTKKLPKGFAVTDDDGTYELVLVASGNKGEEIVATLQQMLALNRNQVKDLLEDLPTVLLTGINRRKGEMLQAQLNIHGATADIRALGADA